MVDGEKIKGRNISNLLNECTNKQRTTSSESKVSSKMSKCLNSFFFLTNLIVHPLNKSKNVDKTNYKYPEWSEARVLLDANIFIL